MQALTSSVRLVRCTLVLRVCCVCERLLSIYRLKRPLSALQAATGKVQTRQQRQAVVCSAVPQEQTQRRAVLAAGLAAGARRCREGPAAQRGERRAAQQGACSQACA